MLSKLLQHRKLLYGREYLFLLRFRRRYFSRFISIWISGFPVWWEKIWYFSSFIESPVGNFHTSAINVFWSRPTLVQIKSWSKNSSFLDMTRMWKDDNITIKLSLFQSVQIFSGCVINIGRRTADRGSWNKSSTNSSLGLEMFVGKHITADTWT